MSKDQRQTTERLDIARERIAAERTARTGRLDLGNLGLTRPPSELAELDWLEALRLGGFSKGSLRSLVSKGEWEAAAADNPNRIEPIASWLTGLLRLRSLDCSGTNLQDLPPLADLSALQSFDCQHTQVADLTPLAGCSALQDINCSETQVADLAPLAGLSALQSLNCKSTQVADLTPLAGCSALQSLNCAVTQVADLTPLAGLSALRSLDCWITQVADLTPLADCSALESLDCQHTQVADLAPLAGCSALQFLNCERTQVADLAPLAGCSALRFLHCSDTQVADLAPLAGCSALQFLNCERTQVADLTPLAGCSALQSLNCERTQVADLTPLADCSALESLDCQHTQVADLAPLAGCSALQFLNCERTQVADLAPLAGCSALRFLHCSDTQVADLAPLAGCSALQFLNCERTQVADLTPLAGCSALQSLNCERTQVADLTPLADCSALESLDCQHTQVADLTPLAGCSALQSLNCERTQVADLTPLAECSALESLDCWNTPVADLTPLAGLSALESLNCWKTQVADLAPLAGCSALQSLNCKWTEVADLTPLAGCSALQSLNCERTQVADLTPLAGCSALESLDCGHTQVADLAPLAGCSALESLSCWGTQVADLTPLARCSALQSLICAKTQVADLAPLAGCSALQKLNCWGTQVIDLPNSVIGLPGLEELVIQAQPGLGHIPAEVLSQGPGDNCLARLRAHLADLDTGAAPLQDLKVIVLGNGCIGKTQLCRRLRGETFEADADSTHGISVTSTELAMPENQEDAVLNLWDFGGQDIYHGTHALFMRTRAVFLLVWTPASEQGDQEHDGMVFRNRPLPYWLEYIRHLGGDRSPVILIQNQCDGGRGEYPNLPVAENLLSSLLKDGRLFTRIAYSAQDETGRAYLLDALQRAVQALRESRGRPMIGRNRLAVWEQLRAWRDTDARETDATRRKHRLLPYQEFATLCRKHGVQGADTFVEVLHRAGMVFYQPQLFDNQLVLDQSWMLNAVYALFTREGGVYDILRRLGGRFTRTDLDALLWRKRGFSEADQASLLGMMETSGICFVHRYGDSDEETEYVAPDLLPAGPPERNESLADALAARWDLLPNEPLETAFVYPFLSPAIARSVLSALGGLAGSTALYWRYGLCLYDKETCATAMTEELPDAAGHGGRIRIRVKGEGAATLLARLVERIKELDERLGRSGQLVEPLPASRMDPNPEQIQPATPPPTVPDKPEVYVSYAWARERREPLVDALCTDLAAQGLHIRRDSTELQPGDRISRYMEQLSAGRCVLVILSRDYLRSEYCMTELYRLYTNARQRDQDFLRRIVPLIQPDACIATPRERIDHAVHWKTEHHELDRLIREHGPEVIGAEDFRRFRLIGEFYRHIGDMLAYANDVLTPRDRPSLFKDKFAPVKRLIERALA